LYGLSRTESLMATERIGCEIIYLKKNFGLAQMGI
jgi:hypothetical protein